MVSRSVYVCGERLILSSFKLQGLWSIPEKPDRPGIVKVQRDDLSGCNVTETL